MLSTEGALSFWLDTGGPATDIASKDPPLLRLHVVAS
jgi:hypothetical protein